MLSRRLTAALVAFGVFAVWLYALQLRLPYMDQIPVYDADATTAEAHMWARMWWDHGPLKMWFSTPRAPLSIEAPSFATYGLYESWPPGAFVPIYVAAKVLGVVPSVPLVNWINTILHGLIALTTAFIALNLAQMNRLGNPGSGLIALSVSFPILLSRGLLFVFSQIYDVVTAVLIYTAIFILLEVLFYRARSSRHKRIIGALQLVTIFCAFLVDWLPYTLFVFWLVTRVVAGYLGIEPRLTLRRLVALSLVPISAFSIYLGWRFFAPDSLARIHGISSSIDHLHVKVLQRMNLLEGDQISGFGEVFVWTMHGDYLSTYAFPLIVASTLITLALLVVSFRRAADAPERRSIFATASILMLVLIPFYAHMLIIYEHTFIHRWAITKAMFAYALIPFALLPIGIFSSVRLLAGPPKVSSQGRGLAMPALVLGLVALGSAAIITHQEQYLIGRIDPDNYLMWMDIGRNTRYQDVVVSPVLQADPITPQVGASYKLVHHADNFADVDTIVEHVCGDFNVVLALPKGSEPGAFAARQPAEVIDTGRIRLLRFASYPGKAIGCS